MARFEWNEREFYKQVQRTESKSVEDSCRLLTNESKSIMKSGSYAEYKSKRPSGGVHWSSKPWDAPAPDTNLLKGSISYQTSDGKSGGIQAPATSSDGVHQPPNQGYLKILGVVGTSVKYGGFLESGTSRMMPRPYLRPPLTNRWQDILKIFERNGKIFL